MKKTTEPLMSKRAITKCCQTWAASIPEPKTELSYHTPFQLLICVMLSAQATDKAVNAVSQRLFAKAATPQHMLELSEIELQGYLQKLGLFRTKSRNVRLTSQILLEKHQGQVPRSQAELEALPGVGRKTANIVRHALYDEPTIAVDTHVFRVSNRMRLAPGKTPNQVEAMLYQQIPNQYHRRAHHWLILHGRYTCKARRPLCQQCSVQAWCLAPEANNQSTVIAKDKM